MKNQLFLIIIFLSSVSCLFSQSSGGVALNCGNTLDLQLHNGTNDLCTVEGTNIKLTTTVKKGKIISFQAVLEDKSITGLKWSVSKSEKEDIKNQNKPTNPPTKEICKPFCIVVKGIKYCLDGCIPTGPLN